MGPHSITQNMLPRSRNYKSKIDAKKGGKLAPKCYVDQPDSLLNSRGWENPTFTDENPYHLEGEPPQLGDLPGTVINHLLNGMILQVRPQKQIAFSFTQMIDGEYLPSHLAPLSMWPFFSDVGKYWVMENLGPMLKV